MFETSPTTDKLDAALAEAQKLIHPAKENAVNPHFRSTYADLASCWEACRPALAATKISLTQWPLHSTDGRVHLVTRLAHAGEWIRCSFSIPAGKQDAHGYGSTITYLKRFALCAALGIATEDDDGNGAVETPKAIVKKPSPSPAAKAPKAEPGVYVITFGKFKGKTLNECSKEELKNYAAWIDGECQKDAKKHTPQVTEFFNEVNAYLAGDTHDDTGNIPF